MRVQCLEAELKFSHAFIRLLWALRTLNWCLYMITWPEQAPICIEPHFRHWIKSSNLRLFIAQFWITWRNSDIVILFFPELWDIYSQLWVTKDINSQLQENISELWHVNLPIAHFQNCKFISRNSEYIAQLWLYHRILTLEFIIVSLYYAILKLELWDLHLQLWEKSQNCDIKFSSLTLIKFMEI